MCSVQHLRWKSIRVSTLHGFQQHAMRCVCQPTLLNMHNWRGLKLHEVQFWIRPQRRRLFRFDRIASTNHSVLLARSVLNWHELEQWHICMCSVFVMRSGLCCLSVHCLE